MNKVRCQQMRMWSVHCQSCKHGQWHKPESIRQSASESLPCDEYGDYCFQWNIMKKCGGYTDAIIGDVNNC